MQRELLVKRLKKHLDELFTNYEYIHGCGLKQRGAHTQAGDS